MPQFTKSRGRQLWTAVIISVLVIEAWVLLVDRDTTFGIQGDVPRLITQFGEGRTVRQAFLMRGAGLHQVQVLISSARKQELPIDWTLWRGLPDEPATFTVAFQSTQRMPLRAGRQWITFSFPRDGVSNDRWYTIEITAKPDAGMQASEPVAIHASHDNPERGGALWINDVRQPGSLTIRADGRGRTLYGRFQLEAAPHLPGALASPVVQLIVVISLHWAFWTVAVALFNDAWAGDRHAR